jgi:RNA polymerase sigma-70 factor (ECF subfamily)
MADIDFDIVLFYKIKSGDEKAMELIFRKYYQKLCLFVQSYVGDSYLSEDLVTDLFTHIWIKKDKIEISYSLKAYLYTAAKNSALTYLRKKRLPTENIDDLNKINISNEQMPYDKFDNEQKEENINTILSKIPPRSRQVFVLHRFEEMKYKEIAEFLEISIKTVENHISKALKVLHENKDLIIKLLKIIFVFLRIIH